MPTIYAAMRDRLLVVTGGPGDWRVTERLAGRDLESVAAHHDVPERAFCGTFEDGLHRTEDGGDTWERVGAEEVDPGEDPETAERRGVEGVSVMSTAVDPRDPDEVWAGTEPSELFRSTDGGETWSEVGGVVDQPSADEWYFPPRPYTHHVRWIELDPHDADRAYVGIEAGALLLTRDDGETWEERPPGSRRDNHSLATHPTAEGRVYSAAGDGYAESRDSGESWEQPQAGLDHRYVWSVAVDPADADTVLVSSASGASTAHGHGGAASAESYLYRRVGEEWERLDGRGIPTGEGVLRAVLAPGGDGEFYAVNNRGLFRSADAGSSWEHLDVEWPEELEEQTARGLVVV